MAVKYSVDLCGITHIALTLLDVLSGLDHVKICTGYKYRGQRLDYFRADMDTLAEVEPIYETLPGWRGNITRLPPVRRAAQGSAEVREDAGEADRRADQDGQRRPGADGDAGAVGATWHGLQTCAASRHATSQVPRRRRRRDPRAAVAVELFDAFDQAQRDHVVVPDRGRASLQRVHEQKRVLTNPGRLRIANLQPLAAGKMQPKAERRARVQAPVGYLRWSFFIQYTSISRGARR